MFKVDDAFYDHPKVKSIPRGGARKGAVALWTLAGSYCDRYSTDGFVPAHQIEEFGATAKEAQSLVDVELWHRTGHGCPSCPPVPAQHYLFHDWGVWNDMKVDKEKRRSKARDRMRKLRNGESTGDAATSNVRPLLPGSSREQAGER